MHLLSIGARRKIALPAAALVAATALVGAFAPASFADDGAAAPAAQFASAPTTPAGAFFAELCSTDGVVDQTTENPKATQGSGLMPDLTRVFGQRLADYNAGKTVLLYNTGGGGGGGTPNCGVHYDAATDGPVSEWMYCTDQKSKTCSQIDKNGLLHQGSKYVGQLENQTGNSRLSADQEKIISYIIRHDMPVLNDGFISAVDVASEKTVNSRNAKQALVWCVSDYEAYGQYIAAWCEDGIGGDKQAAILASMPETPELTITPASTEVAVSGKAKLTLTTNLVNQPITLAADAPGLVFCEPQTDVTLSADGVLTIPSAVGATKSVDLCISSDTPAEISVQASATAHAGDEAAWVQSPGAAGVACQVYALTRAGAATDMAATATITVAEDNSGGANANGANADANGANADANGADADANGANADADANGADAQGNNAQGAPSAKASAQGAASAKASAQASAGAQGGNAAEGNNAQGAANGAKGGLAETGAASPLIAGTAALLLVAAGAGALAMRRRSAR